MQWKYSSKNIVVRIEISSINLSHNSSLCIHTSRVFDTHCTPANDSAKERDGEGGIRELPLMVVL